MDLSVKKHKECNILKTYRPNGLISILVLYKEKINGELFTHLLSQLCSCKFGDDNSFGRSPTLRFGSILVEQMIEQTLRFSLKLCENQNSLGFGFIIKPIGFGFGCVGSVWNISIQFSSIQLSCLGLFLHKPMTNQHIYNLKFSTSHVSIQTGSCQK